MEKIDSWFTPAIRKWIYGIATAALPLLVLYGILDENAVPLWTALVGAFLVPGMAAVHTNTSRGDGAPERTWAD